MIGNKLMLIVSRMNGVEKRAFSKFLDSAYFNKRPELLAFWKLLLEGTKQKQLDFSPETLYRGLFGEKKFDATHFRHLSSWLLKKVEQFFVQRKKEKQEFDNQLSLAITYREKKLEPLFKKHLDIARKTIRTKKLDPERFLAAYRVEFEQYAFIESQNRTDSTNLQGLNDSLDEYILISKLKQCCLMLAHQAVYKVQYDFSFLDVLLKYLEGSQALAHPAIALYYHCYRAFNENDANHFYQFKNLLINHRKDFSSREVRGLLLFAINFCIRKMNEDDPSYDKEAWDFYLMGMEEKLLYENDYLGRFTYKNIAALGIKLKKYNWTRNFIHQYKTDLSPKFQENYFNYNLAQLYFVQGKYKLAMPLLALLDDTDILLNFDAKVLLLKMYFELNEYDALHSLLDSFKVMLQRKKLVGYHKNYYRDLIQLTRNLVEVANGSLKAKQELRLQVVNKDKFPEKDWFIRMLE